MPRDRRILPIADALTTEPGDRRSLDDWAEALEFSSKTLARIFQNETGISFHSWRQLVRVQSALEQLSNGASVALVARSLGYAQTSTFIDAFRRVLNVTPGQYRAHALAA
ncbi:helix-turn-helix transcriptional regulator [Pseudoclavibacter helvolus]